MTDRKTLSRNIRFEVFKRDSFTCQYCGRRAPDVVLEIDHIKPVSTGGDNEIINLITSCFDCNRGKSDRELSDDSVVVKRRAQSDHLQEISEQRKMMVEWQYGLVNIDNEELDQLVSFINSFMKYVQLSELGIERLRKSLCKYGLIEMLESTRISAKQYLSTWNKEAELGSVNKFTEYIHRIANTRNKISKKPYLGELFRLKNIVGSKCTYVNDYRILGLLEKAYLKGHSIEDLENIIRGSNGWRDWNESMEDLINGE